MISFKNEDVFDSREDKYLGHMYTSLLRVLNSQAIKIRLIEKKCNLVQCSWKLKEKSITICTHC